MEDGIMDKKRSILLATLVLFIGMLTTIGSYAYWSWQSNTTKSIIFNTSDDLSEYINYDEGESRFVGDFQVSNTYTDGIHSTIAISKKAEAANVDILATIYMDVNAIGSNMAKSSALKWVVTSGNATNPGSVLAKGNFIGASAGDQLSVKDCLYSLLLSSANDVANALAEHIAGSISDFALLMNERAESIGCTNTHFVNSVSSVLRLVSSISLRTSLLPLKFSKFTFLSNVPVIYTLFLD